LENSAIRVHLRSSAADKVQIPRLRWPLARFASGWPPWRVRRSLRFRPAGDLLNIPAT